VRAFIAITLLSFATCAEARNTGHLIPFVGCPTGGQTGLQPAPKSGKSRWIEGNIAARLAYYSPGDIGVVAPRGWHCSAVYGSSGSALIVVPDKQTAEAFRRLRNVPIRGPFVWAGDSFGGTSGRGTVMEAIARYFPSHHDFIRRVREMDLVFEPLPRGSYRHDLIRHRTSEYVRFMTPAWHQGEGANSLIAPNGTAVEGFRELVGPRNEPDLWGVDVRLPSKDDELTDAILSNALKH